MMEESWRGPGMGLAAESAGMIVTRSEMADTGHKFTPEEKEKVKAWLQGRVDKLTDRPARVDLPSG